MTSVPDVPRYRPQIMSAKNAAAEITARPNARGYRKA